MFSSVSTNGSALPLIQLGTGGTATTTGYVSTTSGAAGGAIATTNSTSGFITYSNAATYVISGTYEFTNVSGNIWVGSSIVSNTTTVVLTTFSSGVVTLSGVLNMLRITTSNGTDTFDAGTVNILYE
jgi:hypothetical protein